MPNNLTDKQEMFCYEYLIDLNATQAAIRAGYSPHTATKQGSRLLTYANVQKRISEFKSERTDRLQIDADWILQETRQIYEKCKEANDLKSCLKALDQISKHASVKAYDKVVPLATDNSNSGSIIIEVNDIHAKYQLEELKGKLE